MAEIRERALERRHHLDSLYNFSLILLGILSAAEFQYFISIEEEKLFLYALKVFTMPFLVLILFWLIKEIFRDVADENLTIILTEFCWSFLNITLFYFLLAFLTEFWVQLFTFIFSIFLTFLITWAYDRTYAMEQGLNIRDYYRRSIWILVLRLFIFGLSYVLLLGIVYPPPDC